MRLITSTLVAAGAAAGIVGAVVTYQTVADTPAAEQRPAAAAARPPDPTPEVKVTYLPCEPGTKLVKGTCIRTKHRTVVRELPAAAPPAGTSAPSTPARSRSTRGTGGGGENKPAARPSAGDDADEGREESDDHGDDDDDESDHDDEHDDEHEGSESDD